METETHSTGKIVICIVHYLNPDLTLKCIDSVVNSTKHCKGEVEVVIYANSCFPHKGEYQVIESDNIGYAGAGASAYRLFKNKCKYFILLNNDLIVYENWFENLIEYMDNNSYLPIAGCRITSEYGEHNKGSWSIICENIDRPSPEPFYVSGSCMIARAELVDELFDPDYFIWCEDVWACWRQRIQGKKIGVCWNASIIHKQSYSMRQSVKKMGLETIGERNKLWLIFTFYELATILKVLPLVLIWTVSMRRRLKAFFAFLQSFPKLLKKRMEIQGMRKVSDAEVTKLMTSRLSNHNELLNEISKLYCQTVGLKTIDTQK